MTPPATVVSRDAAVAADRLQASATLEDVPCSLAGQPQPPLFLENLSEQ